VLSRIIDGARYTIGVALIATLLACTFGRCSASSPRCAAAGSIRTVAAAGHDRVDPSKMLALVIVAAFRFVDRAAGRDGGGRLHAGLLPDHPLARRQHQRDGLRDGRATRGEGRMYIMAAARSCPTSRVPLLADMGLRFVYAIRLAREPVVPRTRRAAAGGRLGIAGAREPGRARRPAARR
jgi:peptide/nickel transport system permease protein